MKKFIFVNLAALTLAGQAFAADFPVNAAAPFAERFNWTGCYAGMHLGGGFANKNITDPVFLVQDNLIGAGTTTGVTTVSPRPTGAVIGAQIGCDYEFASSVVIGVEGAVSGSTMKGTRLVALPGSVPDTALVEVNTDFLPSLTARIGYAFDNVLLYARGGAALAGDQFRVSGTLTTTGIGPYDFRGLDNRFGWVVGGGVDWAFSRNWSAFVEYDYYQFGTTNILMTDQISGVAGLVSFSQHVQVVKAGVNFHVWGPGF
jgi:outer membrane immunogenic protein